MRLHNWRRRFIEMIDRVRAEPFIWSTHDCLSGLVIPAVIAITGDAQDLQKYCKRYKTARGALGAMRRSNYANLGDFLADHFTEIHPSQAVAGDLAAIPTDDGFGHALGVVNGERVFVMLEQSLGTRSLTEVERAFKVE